MKMPEYRVWITAPKEGWLGVDYYDTFDWDNRMRMVSSIHFPLGSYSGKDITAESISEPDYYADGWLGANYSYGDTIESFEYILMEYTGLKDKNGVKIFEGDIVKSKTNFYNKPREVITVIGWNDNIENDSFGEPLTLGYSILGYDFEIIGNIHQNPELLK